MLIFFYFSPINKINYLCLTLGIGDWGLGIGDWGLGIGDWGLLFLFNFFFSKKRGQ